MESKVVEEENTDSRPEQEKPERGSENRCGCSEKKPIKAHCGRCQAYICGDCHLFKHIDHDGEIVDLASKCTRFLVDYQRLSRTASLLEDRRQMHIRDVSIETIAAELKTLLLKARDQLQSDLTRVTESSLQYLASSPMVRELAAKKASLANRGDRPLQQMKRDLEGACRDLVLNMSDNRYESADRLINSGKLEEYEEALKKLAADSGEELDVMQELKQLKQTQVEYSYDPRRMLGLIRFDADLRKPNRLLQLDRSGRLCVYNIDALKPVRTTLTPSFPLPYRFITIEVAGAFYLTGGDDDHGHYFAMVYVCDEFRGMFVPQAPMHDARSRHALAAVGAHAFLAVGGETQDGATKCCELYDASENTWRTLASLNEARCGHAACTLGGRTVYVFGGWNQNSLNSFERLEIAGKKKWEALKLSKKPSLKALQLLGAVGIRDHEILLFGGYKQDEELVNECTVLNVKSLELAPAPALPLPDAFIASEVRKVEDAVFAFGYETGTLFIYDSSKKEWSHTSHKALTA